MLQAPSPTKATVRPGEPALVLADRQQVGQQLARVESSVSALTTGTPAYAAISSIASWP